MTRGCPLGIPAAVTISFYAASGKALPGLSVVRGARPAVRPQRPIKMLEAAIWIGVALAGLVLLALFERARSSSFIRANGEAIKAALPIAALFLLGFVAGSVAMLFFFLFFLVDFWQYALVIGAVTFILLFIRIRRNWSEFAGVPQSGLVEQEGTAAPGLFPQIGAIALQAAGAMAVLFMMVPVLTGGFLLYMFVSRVTGSLIANLLLAVAALCLTGYLYSRLRAPPPDTEGSD